MYLARARTTAMRLLRRLAADRRGSMVTLTAASMTVLVGFAGMGVDVSMWYAEKRRTQNIADAAAVAAAYARQEGASLSVMEQVARTEAIRNGFQEAGDNQVSVALASSSGPSLATPFATVQIQRRAPVFFLSVFMDQGPLIAASATSGARVLGSHCVIGLDHVQGRTVEFIGNTYANIGCGVASNSSSAQSLYVGGNATLIANPAQANGDIVVDGNGTLITQLPPMPFSPRVADPFADRNFPSVSGSCDFNGLDVNNSQTIGPSLPGGSVRICGQMRVRPQGNLTLQPGIYYVDGGDVLFQGTVTGDGVTIVLTGPDSSSIGEIDMRAQATVTLSAPTSGPFQGLVVHQDTVAGASGDHKFNGGASLTIAGAIHIPNQPLTYNGGSDSDGCTVIVARIVKFSGTSYLRNSASVCDSVGLTADVLPTQEQIVLLN